MERNIENAFTIFKNVYNLKITGLTKQQDMQALVKILLSVPGLDSEKISKGLKAPPFTILSVEQEEQALKVKTVLEKLGAMCAVEDPAAAAKEIRSFVRPVPAKKSKSKHSLGFWAIILAVIALGGVFELYLSSGKTKKDAQKDKQKQAVEQSAGQPAQPQGRKQPEQQAQQSSPPQAHQQAADAAEKAKSEANAAKSKNELKNDLSKNPYNSGAWKALYEKLENEGDAASASKAKESYDQALKAQMVLSSLAKAFGNDIRVEITEGAVYYRISKNLSDSDFYYEAEKLRETLNAKFPEKDMVLENYSPDNKVKTIRLKGAYSSEGAAQPKENDSPK